MILQQAIKEASDLDHDTQQEPQSEIDPVHQEITNIIKEDLQFLLPLIKEYPKCYWLWNHRKWLLKRAGELLPSVVATKFWQGELVLDSKMLGYDSRNFHGWSYRREIVAALQQLEDERPAVSLLEQEFAYTTKMVKANLSNFSAWHNRSRLIAPLLDERQASGPERREVLDRELDFITQALYTDPYDQSLWFYHQNLISIVLSSDTPLGDVIPDLTSRERQNLLVAQLDTLRDMEQDATDCKWVYQYLLTYSLDCQKIAFDNQRASQKEMRTWLDNLARLDPLRRARWYDLGRAIGL